MARRRTTVMGASETQSRLTQLSPMAEHPVPSGATIRAQISRERSPSYQNPRTAKLAVGTKRLQIVISRGHPAVAPHRACRFSRRNSINACSGTGSKYPTAPPASAPEYAFSNSRSSSVRGGDGGAQEKGAARGADDPVAAVEPYHLRARDRHCLRHRRG